MSPCGSLSVFSTARKCGRSLPLRIFDREIFLVIAHHRDQHFFRQRQKLRIEAAQNRRRKFGQVHDRIEQRLVFAPARAGNGPRRGIESLANLMLAFTAPQNFGRAQRINVGRSGPRNRHRRHRSESGARANCFPARMPSNSSGIVSPSSIATSQRTGRTKRSFGLRQYIFFGQ